MLDPINYGSIDRLEDLLPPHVDTRFIVRCMTLNVPSLYVLLVDYSTNETIAETWEMNMGMALIGEMNELELDGAVLLEDSTITNEIFAQMKTDLLRKLSPTMVQDIALRSLLIHDHLCRTTPHRICSAVVVYRKSADPNQEIDVRVAVHSISHC